MSDKRILHIISASTLTALLLIFFIPFDTAGRILAAVALASAAVLSFLFLKKRPIPSLNKQEVLLIVSICAAVFLMLYYMSGIKFGYYKNHYAVPSLFLSHFLPIAIIIFATEVMRFIARAQESRRDDIICYFSCLMSDVLICSTASMAISTFANFMELVATAFFPAITANLLYHYLTKRYGMYPSLIYRAATTLYIYIIPYSPNMANSLFSFIRILIPIAIYIFIDALYEKKRRYALGKKNKLEIPITVIALTIMIGVVMLVSNQFRFGALVIATDSMTGELNRGDAAIFERYDDQPLEEGQVIVFEKDKSMIVHRLVDIEYINGQIRYYTKGDANEDNDAGYITRASIVGLVDYKVPYIGFPTLWMRSLFSH